MTTDTNTESRVDEPAGLDDIETGNRAQRTKLDRLEALSDEVDALYGDAERMDASSRETVAHEMRELQHDFASFGSIDDLEAAKDRVAEVIAAPYRQSVKRARASVCKTVGVDARLAAETVDELDEALRHCDADDLRATAAAFGGLETRLTALTDAARAAVGQAITADAYGLLNAPETKLEALVERVEEQAKALEAIDDALSEVAWQPDAHLAETSDYYGPGVDPVEADRIVEYVGAVGDRVSDTDDLGLADVVHTHLEGGLPVAEPTELVDLFERVSRGVTRCAGRESAFVRAARLADELEEPAEHDATAVTGYVSEVRTFIEAPVGEEPVTRLAAKLHSLDEAYDEWTGGYARRLSRDGVAISAVEQYLADAPAFESPTEAIALTGGEGAGAAETVAEHPVAAVTAHRAYEDWVDTLRGATAADGGADIDHLLALVRGETISAADVDPAEFATLEELLGDVLTLRLTGGPAEAV